MILLDEFYKDLYMNVFKKWICMQENPNYIIKEHKDFIQIESSYGIAEVTFNLYCIIELKVVSKKKNEIDFYLHFQMNTLKHAVSLFNEMLESLLKLSDEAKTKVLLCCSGGLTTSYFAREINEANKLLKNAIEVSAVGYNQLYQIGKQFDIIFLAPQISYLHAQIQSILKEQVVLKIPPLVFARYDVGTMIKDIEQAQIKKTKQIKKEEISLKLKITNKKPIVCLVIYKNKERIHIVYRIYDKGMMLLQNEIIKYTIHIQDIYDLIDTLIIQYPKISIISLSLPGIIDQGKVFSTYIEGIENINLEEKLKQRYKQQITLYNDINSATAGYYVSHQEKEDLFFIFQAISLNAGAGAGCIINGKLIEGFGSFAGEVSYLPLQLSHSLEELSKTPQGALEILSKIIMSVMCIVAPHIIVVFSELLPDLSALEEKVKEMMPNHQIPKLITDYHVHTEFSDDSSYLMEEVIKDAINMKMDEICFTDHVDYGIKRDWNDAQGMLYRKGGPGEPEKMPLANVNYPKYFEKIEFLRNKYPEIIIKQGMEFGMQVHTIDQYQQLFNKYPFDFIILSCHQVEDKEFWTQDFQRGRTQKEYNERYYQEILDIIKVYKDYSVLGHLDLIIRYDNQGVYPFEKLKPIIKKILEIVIKDGKGIEVNTSSHRYGLKDSQPSKDILKLYKELGGKIITIGSDSHKKEHLGTYIEETKALLKELGFESYCTFDKMKPIYHEL